MSETDSLFPFDLPSIPDFSIENRLLKNGKVLIAGVDEVGRGPLAGPVVAAAVILDPVLHPKGLNDSKKLTPVHRETLFHEILKNSYVSWSAIPAQSIDRINIREATLLAMTEAVVHLPVKADAALIDGRDVPNDLTHIGQALIKGDARSVSVSAASIVAKVVRDRMMLTADKLFPSYGFSKHKGYGSAFHREALNKYGPCILHRYSFSPIRER